MFLLPLKNRSSTGTVFQGQSLLNELSLLLHLTLLHLNFDLNLQGLVMHLFDLFSDFSHNRQWNWQLVYFVHHKNHLISSQSHSSIDTSKLDFSWTNVYKGTYHLVKASGGWWKFSRSFHLWTEEHLTINTEAMDKIRLVLLQAWYKMNVRSGE